MYNDTQNGTRSTADDNHAVAQSSSSYVRSYESDVSLGEESDGLAASPRPTGATCVKKKINTLAYMCRHCNMVFCYK